MCKIELSLGKLPERSRSWCQPENLLMRRAAAGSNRRRRDLWHGPDCRSNVRNSGGEPRRQHGGLQKQFLLSAGLRASARCCSPIQILAGCCLGRSVVACSKLLFDGKPEAVAEVASRAASLTRQRIAKDRERLLIPADAASVSGLAKHYASKEFGDLAVSSANGVTTFDLGEWKSTVASRKNDDGTISFITIDPGTDGFEFVVGERGGKRVLIIRDGQHEYVFNEVA